MPGRKGRPAMPAKPIPAIQTIHPSSPSTPSALSLALCSAVFVILFGAGCQYEYDVIQPQAFAGHVGTKSDYVIKLDPLEYRLLTYDNRLVLRAFNPTDDLITLIGARSAVVDPQNQSHPLPTLSIAPHSYIKLILPPMRPQLVPQGPTIGVGFTNGYPNDAGYYRTGYSYGPGPGPPAAAPTYLAVGGDDSLYWDWDGQSSVRLELQFDRAGKIFTDNFVFQRVKM
jgi:hypothetical protein